MRIGDWRLGIVVTEFNENNKNENENIKK